MHVGILAATPVKCGLDAHAMPVYRPLVVAVLDVEPDLLETVRGRPIDRLVGAPRLEVVSLDRAVRLVVILPPPFALHAVVTLRESTHAAVANDSDLVAKLLEKAKAEPRVRDVIGTYFLARAYAFKDANRIEEEQLALTSAASFIPNAVALTPKDVYEKYFSLKKRHKELRSTLAERSAFKIEVRASSAAARDSIAGRRDSRC